MWHGHLARVFAVAVVVVVPKKKQKKRKKKQRPWAGCPWDAWPGWP
jgi:hypothetical protein